MTTVSIRLSEKEKRELRKHGKVSTVIKEALASYLASRRSARAIQRLKELQHEARPKRGIEFDVKLLREDRTR